MSDITKCSNDDCLKKNKCWRYLAPNSVWQSWNNFNQENLEDCEFYWKVKLYD